MEDKRLTGWTEERVARLKELWESGQSASQIAGDLGSLTRNAVIGKLHRLGLCVRKKSKTSTPRASRIRATKDRVVTMKRDAVENHIKPEPFIIRCVEVDSRHLLIADLNDTTCHWPELDGPEQTYCGLIVKAGKPYCTAHCDIAYTGVPKRPPSADRPSWRRSRGSAFGRAA